MKMEQFIDWCIERSISFSLAGNDLKVNAEPGALTDEVIGQLKAKKAELIEWLKSQQAKRILPRSDHDTVIPLSYSQQRLWIIDQIEHSTEHYNVLGAFRIDGCCKAELVDRSFKEIITRHEILRTILKSSEHGAEQTPLKDWEFNLIKHDFSSLEQAEYELKVKELIRKESEYSFKLDTDLPIRVQFVEHGDEQSILIVNMHHIVSDGWSLGIISSEFIEIYGAYAQQKAHSLPSLPVQYGDYALWQQAYFNGSELSESLDFWRQYLLDMPELHNLPLDFPRPKKQNFSATRLIQKVGKSKYQALKSFAQARNVSMFTLLQTVFAFLVSRHSDELDVVMGVPVAGRNRSELDSLIGFFVNTLAIRTKIDPQVSFDALLAEAKDNILSVFSNQNVPFELIVDELKPRRTSAFNPLCQIKFMLTQAQEAETLMPGLSISEIEHDNSTVRFDLDLSVTEHAEELTLCWHFKTELFSEATIERMAQHYLNLLDGILTDSSATLASLTLTDSVESQALIEMGCGEVSTEQTHSLVRLFEEQVAKHPQKTALAMGNERIPYQQLNQKANRLADMLLEQDIEQGVRVAVYLPPSPLLMVALLGVMKAGACYIPLDPANSSNRTVHILDDADVDQVLTIESLVGDFPAGGFDIATLDGWTQAEWLEEYADENPEDSLAGDDSAYVIYTSGSTGQPKGVEISQSGLLNYCLYAIDTYYQAYLVGSYFVTSHAFDIGIPSLFVPLMSGDCVTFSTHEISLEGLAEHLKQSEPNLLRMTPKHAEGLLALLGNSFKTATPHVFVIGGDSFSVDLARKLQNSFEKSKIYNHYGPTETVVGCCMFDVSEHIHQLREEIPIGLPMHDQCLYVLDAQLRPVPIGIEGELYIAGAGIAKGYLNNAELTAQCFLPNPFGEGRMYKTGDRTCWNSKGELEFRGRMDEQVKIRGYRIEPSEIQYHLSQVKEVTSCLVVAQLTAAHERELVAFYQTDSDVSSDRAYQDLNEKLRTTLSQVLPDYMVPSHFCVLSQWPLNENGKIDKSALPNMGNTQQDKKVELPVSEMEKRLAQLWANLLNIDIEKIGLASSFFELGGNSLLAIRLVGLLRQNFDVEITVKNVFDAPKLGQLAELINASNLTNLRPEILPRQAPKVDEPLSFAQQRLWFIDQLNEGSAQYNIPIAFEVHGTFSLEAAQEALSVIVARHEILRTVYKNDEDGAIQHVCAPVPFVISVHDLSHLQGATQRQSLLMQMNSEAAYVFDLKKDLMVRASFVSLSHEHGALLFNMHHISSDGWSLNVLVREFVQLYRQIVDNKPIEIEPLTLQYADYAVWQRKWLSGDVLQAQLEYWHKALDNVPPVHSLQLDKPRPEQKQHYGAKVESCLSAQVSAQLQQLLATYNLTPFMLMHAALALVLARHSNTSDIVIGTPVANRLQPALEPMIGFFVNTLVLRVNTSHEHLDAYLAHVREVNLGAQDHQDVPFEQLVEYLQVPRSASHTPLFQIMLTTQTDYALANTPDNELGLPDVTLKPLHASAQTVKFDIQVHAHFDEQGGKLEWVFDTSLFTSSHIEQLNTHMLSVLNWFADTLEQSHISDLRAMPMLSAQETQYLLNDVNDTDVDLPYEQCLYEPFIEQVKAKPDAIALYDLNGSMSYIELFTEAYAVCQLLEQLGIQKEELVAVRLAKGRDQVIATLGIMMSGAAYLPVELKWPDSRCEKIAQKAGCRFVFVADQQHQISNLQALSISELKKPALNISHALSHFENKAKPSDLAYVIFTSGSTGEPKGVAIEHRSAVNTILDINDKFKVKEHDKVLAVSALSFDLSVYDLFGLLAAGGSIVFPHDDKASDPAHWLEMVEQYQVTFWDTVPASASLLTEQLDFLGRPCSSPIRNILMSGDWIDPALPKKLNQAFPVADLYSLGGATEGSIWSIYHPITVDTSELKSVPYGKPLANQRFYIVNEHMALVPPGVTGELCIAGEGVARCYFGDCEKTEARFVYHPGLQQRLYRTGDLGRYMPDGNIEFIGRIDAQIKINGFRIELGEIEQKLNASDSVNTCLVKVHVTEQKQKYLVAYVVPQSTQHDETTIRTLLKAELKQALPSYMVPDVIVVIHSWPLTANGKVDHKALPAPELSLQCDDYTAPKNDVERELVAIWSDLLGSPASQISTSSDFFEIRGNSLLATRMVFKVKQQLGLTLELKAVYQYPTIVELGDMLTRQTNLNSANQFVEQLDESEVEEFSL